MDLITVDLKAGTVRTVAGNVTDEYTLGSPEGFAAVSRAWLRAGWDAKHVYSFTWLGRPIIQLPEDLIRLQEVIWRLRPDVILETGVAHGGSAVFHASLCQLMGHGRVVAVDVDIRPHNRSAIEAHPLAPLVTMIEGDSVAPATVAAVRAAIQPGESVLVVLDSNHTRDHVRAELEAYAPLVTPGSYAIATDGIMEQVVGGPRTSADWEWNNPRRAALEFAAVHPQFVIEEPRPAFNEGHVRSWVTYWPGAFLKRVA